MYRTLHREHPHVQNAPQGTSPCTERSTGNIPMYRTLHREHPHVQNAPQGTSPCTERSTGNIPMYRTLHREHPQRDQQQDVVLPCSGSVATVLEGRLSSCHHCSSSPHFRWPARRCWLLSHKGGHQASCLTQGG
ncbi:hypothetical protein ACOMHN_024979 [Nucella lapillus]